MKFHIQLCIALIALLVVFLVGIDRIENKVACTFMSCVILYFALSSAFWMGAEAVVMYKKLIVVSGSISTRFVIILSVICWGVPLTVVLIALCTLATGYNALVFTKCGTLRVCFISDVKVLLGTFLAPVTFIMIFNTIMLVLSIRILIKSTQKIVYHVDDGNTKATMVAIIGIYCTMILFGITWTFGILFIYNVSNTFQILFAICNVLQGFCNFTFIVLFKNEGRAFWINLLKPKSYKKMFIPTVVSCCNSSHPSRGRTDAGLESIHLNRNADVDHPREFCSSEGTGTTSINLQTLDPIEQENSLPLHEHGVELRYLNNGASYKSHSSVQDRVTKGSLEDVPNPLSLHIHPTELKAKDRLGQKSSSPSHGKSENGLELSLHDNETGALDDRAYLLASAEGSPKHTLPSSLYIKSSDIRILDVIGQGEFCVVYKGYHSSQYSTDVVAIKTLKGFVDGDTIQVLISECIRMKHFNHPNVMTLIGVCLDGGPVPYIILPFMANGSLLSYLTKMRANLIVKKENVIDIQTKVLFTKKQLMDMCLQVAKGMEYLASEKVVHRDLAARNCMIDMHMIIKVADFGLSVNTGPKNYFRLTDMRVKLPVMWMAPESLSNYVFSEKSDVWSYGLTCWEIFTGGQTPYAGTKPSSLLTLLQQGERLQIPNNAACDDEMYSTMLKCWEMDPSRRPSFSILVQDLSRSLEDMAGYLYVGAFTDSKIVQVEHEL